MPTYEYRCKQCNETFDVVQSFNDDPLTTCSACGGPLRKVFGNIGIAFKGNGFYRTDSRNGTGSKERRSESGESSSTGGESGSGGADGGSNKTGAGSGSPDSSKSSGSKESSPSGSSSTSTAAV